MELGDVEVNVEEVERRTEGETQDEEEGCDLDPEQVRQGREEMNCIVKTLGMLVFGLWEEATSKTGKVPTTTKWIDRVKKNDDGREFVRCRLVARDFKPRREGPRDVFVRGSATGGGKESIFCIRCRRVQEAWEVCQAEEMVM